MIGKNSIGLLIVLIALSCGNTKSVTDKTMEKTPQPTFSTLWVNSFKSDCKNAARIQYYLLTQEGTEKPSENWDCLYQEIEGFTFEPGYIYQLKVESFMREGMPKLKLSEVISKELDPEYNRIYDLWALTHLNQNVLEISANRPTIEINLNTMKIMGKALCNQYFGNIVHYTPKTIQFGTLGGTKMMCPEMDMETQFLKALKETDSFQIKGPTLLFQNRYGEEILRFQKID